MAGVYSDYHVVYPGYTSGVNTWNASDSLSAVPAGAFTVKQVCQGARLLFGHHALRMHADTQVHALSQNTCQRHVGLSWRCP